MNNTQDLFLSKDILPLFDYTLNNDSQLALSKLLRKPLSSITEIRDKQAILEQLISCKSLCDTYSYHKIEYSDTYRFLCQFPIDNLKRQEYMAYVFQKRKRNTLLGEYTQLIYFLAKLERLIKENLILEKFPMAYQDDLRFIVNYIASFNPSHYRSKINQDKFGFKAIQKLNTNVCQKRKNGDTLIFFEKLNLLEAYLSIGRAVNRHGFKFAEIGENSDFNLIGFYHPLLKNPVKNNIQVDHNVILITGANMSGKSTLLKSIGLCVYLSHLGLPIPAANGKIPYYDKISIQINHSDDLKNGYSHFMNEIVKLKDVVLDADNGKRCFAVFDELFKGTNYEDALAISVKTIKGLRKFDSSSFFISTHITELKHRLSNSDTQTAAFYIDSEVRDEIPVFSYVLKAGWSNLQIGQLLFKKEGLDDLLD